MVDRIVFRWHDVIVPPAVEGIPGQCLWLSNLSAQPTRETALAALGRLVGPAPEVFDGIPESDWSDFMNADLVEGPDDNFPELPPFSGGVAGRVTAGTQEAQALAWRELWLASECAVYSRYRTVITNGAGEFIYPSAKGQPGLPASNVTIISACSGPQDWDVALSAEMPVADNLDLMAVGSGTLEITARISTGERVPADLELVSLDGSCTLDGFTEGGPSAPPAVFAGLVPGGYALHVSSPFGMSTHGVTVSAAETQPVDIVLAERFLAGRIIDETGTPAVGVSVHMFPFCNGCRPAAIGEAVTDDRGVFVFLNLPGDQRVDLMALHPDGRWCTTSYIYIPGGNSVWLEDLLLHPGGVLKVFTETMTGLPIDGATATIEFAAYDLVVSAGVTGVDGVPGEKHFLSVPADHYAALRCRVTLPGHEGFPPLTFGVEADQENVLLFTDGGGNYTISGQMFAADGSTPLYGQYIQLQAEIASGVYTPLNTTGVEAGGSFIFERDFLPTGRGQIVFNWPCSMGSGMEVLVLDATQGTVLQITADIPVVTGRVVDEQGQTVASAQDLQVVPGNPDLCCPDTRQKKLVDGEFTVWGLLPGLDYDISAHDIDGSFYCGQIEIPADQLVMRDMEIVLCAGEHFSGTILAADSLTPVVSILVELEKEISAGSYLFVGEQFTDSNGVFLFSDIVFPTGRARLIIHHPKSQGGALEEWFVDVFNQPEIILTTGISILKGQVVDEYGTGISGLIDFGVEACLSDGLIPLPEHVRLDGAEFVILGLISGREYNFTAIDLAVEFHCATGGLATDVLVGDGLLLAPCVRQTVTGTLLAADGITPVTSKPVECFREVAEDHWQSVGLTWTDQAGAFTRPDLYLPTGRVRLLSRWPASQGEGQDERVADVIVDPHVEFVTRVTAVHGQIQDGFGQPVANVDWLDVLTLQPKALSPDVRLNSDGTFCVIGVPQAIDCDYVAVDLAGNSYCLTMAIPAGQDVTTGVVLSPCATCILTGILLAADGETALDMPGHSLELWREVTPGEYVFARRTQASLFGGPGEFAFWYVPLPTGRALIRTPWPASQGDGGDEIAVDFGSQVQLDVNFSSTISLLRGYAVDGGEGMVPACDLMVLSDHVPPQRIPWQQLLVDDDGMWWVAGLQPGRMYDFIAYADDGPVPAVYCAQTGLSAGQLARMDVTLPPCSLPANVVRIQVVNPDGDPLPYMYVNLLLDDVCSGGYKTGADKQLYEYWGITDDAGWTEFANLVPGAYMVEVSSEGGGGLTIVELLVPLAGAVQEIVVVHDMESPIFKASLSSGNVSMSSTSRPESHRRNERRILLGWPGTSCQTSAEQVADNSVSQNNQGHERRISGFLCGSAMATTAAIGISQQGNIASASASTDPPLLFERMDLSPYFSRMIAPITGYETLDAEDK
jgi:hypothetical protein